MFGPQAVPEFDRCKTGLQHMLQYLSCQEQRTLALLAACNKPHATDCVGNVTGLQVGVPAAGIVRAGDVVAWRARNPDQGLSCGETAVEMLNAVLHEAWVAMQKVIAESQVHHGELLPSEVRSAMTVISYLDFLFTHVGSDLSGGQLQGADFVV